MEFRILGPLAVVRRDRPLPLGGAKQQAVLALLLLHANRLLATDRMIDELWGEEAPAGAANTVQAYISRLRKVLEPAGARAPQRLLTQPPGYLLRLQPGELDADRFEGLAVEGHRSLERGDPQAAERQLVEALSLWRGPVLANLAAEPFAQAEIIRLEEMRVAALEDRIEAALGLGGHAAQVAELELLLAEHPLRERLWEQLLALYRSGRQAEALQAYHRARHLLGEELGIEPGQALRELEERILSHDPALMPSRRSASRAGAEREAARTPTHNLPVPVTSFVGRVDELAEIDRLLETTRLLTITGAGGSGKTRLALEAAARLLSDYPDGVRLVALDTVTDAGLVPQVAASALAIPEQTDRTLVDVVTDAIGARRLLLVLDNCEHVIGAAAELVSRLLAGCPRLRILATGREPLTVPGETVWQLMPMKIPEREDLPLDRLRDVESVQLFLERAAAAWPGFEPVFQDAAELARICRGLDGLPLALELAATRTRFLGISQIAEHLGDRFTLLGRGVRTAPPHQETLEATVEWSYRLLEPAERQLFDRLSIFVGQFSLAAAASVCSGDGIADDEVINLLSHLVDKSMVSRLEAEHGASGYRLLETLREFGRSRRVENDASAAISERHARFFLDLVERAQVELRGANQVIWLRRLDVDAPNLRAALGWALGPGDADVGLRLATALTPYWEMRGHTREGLGWLERALARSGEPNDGLRAWALMAAGELAIDLGDHPRAAAWVNEALDLSRQRRDEAGGAVATHLLGLLAQHLGDYRRAVTLYHESLTTYERLGMKWHVAWLLHHIGMVTAFQGDLEGSRGTHERSLALFRELGDRDRVGAALRLLAVVAIDQGDYPTATERGEEALSLFIELGVTEGVAHATYTLGDIARLENDIGRARVLYERSVDQLRELGDRRCVASTLRNLGLVAHRQSDTGRAVRLLRESLTIREELGDKAGIAECFEGFAGLRRSLGEAGEAAALYGAAEALRKAIGSVRPASETASFSDALGTLRAELGLQRFNTKWAEGSEVTLAAAIKLALSDVEGRRSAEGR